MSDWTRSGSQLIMPSQQNTGDLECAKFVVQNGTTVVRNLIEGTDTGGTIRAAAIDANGYLTVNSVASGTTIGTINQGTINAGTINIGTFQQTNIPIVIGTSFAVQGTTAGTMWGTIIGAAGTGTRSYISGVDIWGVAGTVDVAVCNAGISGSVGAGVLARVNISPGQVFSKTFNPVLPSATNGTIAYWMGGAGTVNIIVQFWQQ